jgi:DNA-binding HxlR family transcriptional regulator
MNHRSYNQYCGLAYALDIIGERWTLLIVRELVAGPRRFTDLMEGLPGISTNLLADRLKSLEQQGILRRRVLPPPAASTVYELTRLGQGLQQSLLELGRWGSQFVPPTCEGAHLLHLGSYALTPMTFFRAAEALEVDDVYELRIDDEVLQVKIQDGEIHVQQGETLKPDVVLHTDMPVYVQLLGGAITLDEACAAGMIEIDGNPEILRRFFALCGLPKAC